MGLFSGSSETVVASSVYNLAGPEDERNKFVQTVVVGTVLKDDKRSIADNLTSALLAGPGIKQRNLFNWAKRDYDYGMPDFKIAGLQNVNANTVETYINTPTGTHADGTKAWVTDANITYWGEKYIRRNHPDRLGDLWTVTWLEATDEIRIQYENHPSEVIPTPSPNYVPGDEYIFCEYQEVNDNNGNRSDTLLYIYKIGGSEPALNQLGRGAGNGAKEFYPFIPLRFNGKNITHQDYKNTVHYEKPSVAYKKATGQDVKTVIEEINDTPDADDIDYIWMVYGIPLNVVDQTARKYLYEFFKYMMPQSSWTMDQYDDWRAGSMTSNPVHTTLTLKSSEVVNYNQQISWVAIEERFVNGEWKPGAKAGKYVFEKGSVHRWTNVFGFEQRSEVLYLYHQIDRDRYRRLKIVGLWFQNHVYDGEFVEITGHEALDDNEETGFIIPMHNPTLRGMGLVDHTQLTTANTFLVFNSYTVVKKKWWQSGFFQVILVIAVAVISVYFAPAGAVTGGILGTNLAVGTAVGLSGTAAVLAGAAINALAALVLARVVTAGATALFGEKWGAVIAAVVTFVLMNGLTAANTNGALGIQWGSMMRIDNLMKLTNVLGDAYVGWMQGDIAELQADSLEAQEDYETKLGEIREMQQEFGLLEGGIAVDPNWFIGSANNSNLTETPSQFVSRTTMVGSDMIDLSLSMIYDFVEMTTTLPKIGD